jgi:hypothetical protein
MISLIFLKIVIYSGLLKKVYYLFYYFEIGNFILNFNRKLTFMNSNFDFSKVNYLYFDFENLIGCFILDIIKSLDHTLNLGHYLNSLKLKS